MSQQPSLQNQLTDEEELTLCIISTLRTMLQPIQTQIHSIQENLDRIHESQKSVRIGMNCLTRSVDRMSEKWDCAVKAQKGRTDCLVQQVGTVEKSLDGSR